jgi:hypothetical protein
MTRALIPNSTQIPDVILDHWMADLSGAELKVLLYVARRTYGFGKESDNISLNQMAEGIKRRDGSILDHGTGLSRSGVKSACNGLIQRGLLVRVNNRSPGGLECEESTYRLNLFAAPEGVGQKKAYLGQKKAYLGQKNAGGRPVSDRGVGQKLTPQDTDQETEQETAAARRHDEGSEEHAAAGLIEELVEQGVGRAVATRFARKKPETCRRCLEYLPFAKFKTTKGAWLANAIRDEYGPPAGFVEQKSQRAREREAEGRGLARIASQKHQLAISKAKAEKLESAYRGLQETQGDAFAAFSAFVQAERAKTERIALHLSAERRTELLADFDRPDRRLELFEAWISSSPAVFSERGPSPTAGGPDSPSGLVDPTGQVERSLFTAQAS